MHKIREPDEVKQRRFFFTQKTAYEISSSLEFTRVLFSFFFFFQAEDGIRDLIVTGVQTCALPISPAASRRRRQSLSATSVRMSFLRYLLLFLCPSKPSRSCILSSLRRSTAAQ